MNATEVMLYKCTKCGTHHTSHDKAERCCNEPCQWPGCTDVAADYQGYCRRHLQAVWDQQEEERLMRATPVEYFIDADSPVEYNGWHYDLESLVDGLDNPREVSEWCYTAKWVPLQIDLLDVVLDHCSEFSAGIDECYDMVGWPLPKELADRLQQLNTDINAYWAEHRDGCWTENRRERFNLRAQVLEYLKDEDEDEDDD